MRRLPEAIKRRIVEHLGCYCTHAEVAALIAEEFDVSLTPRHIRAYDPSSLQFAGSNRWLDYHRSVRERCQKALGGVAIAHRAYRMRQLQRILDLSLSRGQYTLARQTLEQAAKETGNWYAR